MNYPSLVAKLIGIAVAIWLLGRAVRTAHKLDRAGNLLRWSIVAISAVLYLLAVKTHIVPEVVLWIAIFAFTLFFFLPDLSYYLVLGSRTSWIWIKQRLRSDPDEPHYGSPE
jgi:hypothetical protein